MKEILRICLTCDIPFTYSHTIVLSHKTLGIYKCQKCGETIAI